MFCVFLAVIGVANAIASGHPFPCDGTPGTNIRIRVDALEEFHAELQARPYKNYRSGLQDQEWGARGMIVQDGAGNHLVFFRDFPAKG